MQKKNLSTRIREHIMGHITDGSWPSGHRIPSEAEMMETFSASRMTVHRAVKDLATQGHLIRERGRGTFVAKQIPRSELLNIGDIADEIEERGGTYFREVKHLAPQPLTALTAHVFSGHTETIAFSRMVHYENGIPLQLEDRWVNLDTVPDYLDVDFTQTSAHRHLMRVAPLQKSSTS